MIKNNEAVKELLGFILETYKTTESNVLHMIESELDRLYNFHRDANKFKSPPVKTSLIGEVLANIYSWLAEGPNQLTSEDIAFFYSTRNFFVALERRNDEEI